MKKSLTILLSACLLAGCSTSQESTSETDESEKQEESVVSEIEETLNLINQNPQWTYDSATDSWTLTPVVDVAYPEIEAEQSISVNVPGAYVIGIDQDGDGKEDITAQDATQSVSGNLIIDSEAEITSTNGQIYSAATAPIIFNTGAAGYSSQSVRNASGTYAADGYINVETGNRGKQDTITEDGETVYTGDAPSSLVDQKNAARWLRYNIALGNLPGNSELLITTGGSGGGAHALMFAVSSNHPDFYDYEVEAGAVGIEKLEDGSFSTTATVNGEEVEISDGAWGCVAYSPITSLYDADMALAFEYQLNNNYSYNTEFQEKVAEYLAASYMEFINDMDLSVNEQDINLDLNGDGDIDDKVDLSIEYDPEKYASTGGYGGSYVDYYTKKFEDQLSTYLNELDYAYDWTWFDEDGNKLSDEQVANLTLEEKQLAFIEGRYAKSSSSSQGPGGAPGEGAPMGTPGDGSLPPDLPEELQGQIPSELPGGAPDGSGEMLVGTPDAGTTQSASSSTDSNNYSTYDELLESYQQDIEEIEAGDKYGNNIVQLYNPLNYIQSAEADKPTWVKVIMGAQEGDISMFNSLLIEILLNNQGVQTDIEWQWDGGHVPSEIFGNSLALTVDEMVGEYVSGAVKVEKPAAQKQTTNGTAEQATGTDLSDWVSVDNGEAEFNLDSLIAYRTARASKSTPGFDTIDYGQEDYVFGSSTQDARHWDATLLKIFEDNKEELSSLFNKSSS